MRKRWIVCFALILVLPSFAMAEVTSGDWQSTYYLDEFKMPAEEVYITTAVPIQGTFCNSAVDDALLNVSVLVDDDGISFVLYEYGDNKVKNSYSSKLVYDVIMLDDAKQKTHFTGKMAASGGDRIAFSQKDSEEMLDALKNNASLSFYIAESENPTTNYLFTVGDTAGFSVVLNKMVASKNEKLYQKAVKLYNSGEYKTVLNIFSTLIDYKDSVEWKSKYQKMLEGEADVLLAEENMKRPTRNSISSIRIPVFGIVSVSHGMCWAKR